MGLLRLSGADVGAPRHRAGPAAMNPKGFLELESQNVFLQVAYPGVYPDIVDPPSATQLQEAGRQHADAYLRFLSLEFEDSPIAVKSPRLLTLPFLEGLQNDLDVRVIFLERDLDDQAESIRRVWSDSDDEFKRTASLPFIRDFVTAWTDVSHDLLDQVDLNALHLDFESIIQHPVDAMERIGSFAELPRPSDRKIKAWIDPSLVNRQELRPRFSPNMKARIRRFLHRAVDWVLLAR
jgi:hypothetical protein